MKKTFLYVGNWGFAPAPKGISIFDYNEITGEISLKKTIRYDIAAGQLLLDEERKILYAVNECGERRGDIGGGGYVLAFRIHAETGELTLINEREALLPEPSYLCMDKTGKYIMTCNCADPWQVTKIVKNEDGTFENTVLFDDAGIVLYKINEDGSVGDVSDVALTPGTNGMGEKSEKNIDPVSNHIQLVRVISRLHAIIASPNKELFIACDKGMDRIITFHVDSEKGKIKLLRTYDMEEIACFSRYGAFHPILKVFYSNNENLAQLNCFSYKEETGELEMKWKIPLLLEPVGNVDGKPVGAQDILIHPNGETIYVTLCGLNLIVVLHLDRNGRPELIQSIPSGGNLPRGIQISPDQRFLFAGNMVSGDITTFRIQDDGSLQPNGVVYKAVSPSTIRFFHAK